MKSSDTKEKKGNFDGLSKAVQGAIQNVKTKEPMLTADQVHKAFSSFGFKSNQNNMNDVGYWTTQPASSIGKLMGELKKRREKETVAKEKQAMNTMNGSAGPGAPIHTMMGMGGPGIYSGMGGPNDNSPIFVGDYGLIRFGQNASGDPADTYTTFLVDKKNQSIRQIMSDQAFYNLFGDQASVDRAKNSIKTIDESELQSGGALGNFTILPADYAVKDDGSMRKIEFSPSQLQSRYGGNAVNEKMENASLALLDGALNTIKNTSNSGIPSSYVDNIKNDKGALAMYVNALTYGGYSIPDVVTDIKRRGLIGSGDTTLGNLSIISPEIPKDQYQNTSAYQTAAANTKIQPPASIGNMNLADLDLPIYKISDDAFKSLVPILNIDSPEFKDAMSKVKTTFNDILTQQLGAKNEQDKAQADYAYDNFKNQLESTYGIQLSNNAIAAWNQITGFEKQSADAGLSGSGIESEAVDDYLKSTRLQNQNARKDMMSKEDAATAYYQKSASPEQIQKLIDEDKAAGLPRDQWRTTIWGLTPSQDTLNKISIDALREKYPDYSDDELQTIASSLIDQNGNFRSDLYAGMNDKTQQVAESSRQAQVSGAISNSQQDEEDAYKQFTSAKDDFAVRNGATTPNSSATDQTADQDTDTKSALTSAFGSNATANTTSASTPKVSIPNTDAGSTKTSTTASPTTPVKTATPTPAPAKTTSPAATYQNLSTPVKTPTPAYPLMTPDPNYKKPVTTVTNPLTSAIKNSQSNVSDVLGGISGIGSNSNSSKNIFGF